MKTFKLLIAALMIAPVFVACSNDNKTESEDQYQQNSIQDDKKVMEELGDKGSAALVEPGTAHEDANGDEVVGVVDMTDIK